MRSQMRYRSVDIIHAKGQMTQPAGFRTTGAGRRKREREQLNHILAVERQIAFPGVTLGAIKLALQRKPQSIAIERFTAGVVGRNDGNMVNPFQTQHGQTPSVKPATLLVRAVNAQAFRHFLRLVPDKRRPHRASRREYRSQTPGNDVLWSRASAGSRAPPGSPP
ncbi:hypothetical protein SB00610_03923 [Klebsiella quasipneumoniae subsp. similipneumoniae]|nr:hypothetical protein SB00610_03923 [Klebsiella quasipneumoniae subsp. similipneumoniae]